MNTEFAEVAAELESLLPHLEYSRHTHELWRDCDQADRDLNPNIGDATFHADCVKEYDRRIAAINKAVRVLRLRRTVMSKKLIDCMVNRFLCWKLPEKFAPDAGISFKAEYNEHTPWPARHEPTGTNLFDADQARQMIEHMLGDTLQPLTEQQAIGLANVAVPEIGDKVSGNAVIAFVKAVEELHGIGA